MSFVISPLVLVIGVVAAAVAYTIKWVRRL